MIFIALGSNLGDRREQMRQSLRLLAARQVGILRVSSLYETAPWGKLDQGPFLNAVAEVETALDARGLLALLLEVEASLGRERRERWGPRSLDLDLLEFRYQRSASPSLLLPHPLYPERAFVLAPLAEIAPGFIPTGGSETVSALLERLPPGGIALAERNWHRP
jgi:2-amino-4-hydroxy-6-hydroxymethyldihydropteridine diphosphokinase